MKCILLSATLLVGNLAVRLYLDLYQLQLHKPEFSNFFNIDAVVNIAVKVLAGPHVEGLPRIPAQAAPTAS